MPYFIRSRSFCAVVSGGIFFVRGKSSSSKTRFLLAYSWNSGFEKTSLSSMMHQPHQSEPVKSIKSNFCLVLASSWAWAKLVSQPLFAAPELFEDSWAVELFEHEM